VPPQCQLDVLTDTVYRQLHTAKNSAPESDNQREEVAWTTETSELRKGLLVARTLITERAHGMPVHLRNTTDAPVHLCRGAVVSELHPVVTSIDQRNQAATKKEALSEDEIVTDLLSRVADDVSDDFKDRLEKLLRQHITVFSTGECDLGWTDPVTHRIDTGDHRPIRQQLRHYPPAHIEAIDEDLRVRTCLLKASLSLPRALWLLISS